MGECQTQYPAPVCGHGKSQDVYDTTLAYEMAAKEVVVDAKGHGLRFVTCERSTSLNTRMRMDVQDICYIQSWKMCQMGMKKTRADWGSVRRSGCA